MPKRTSKSGTGLSNPSLVNDGGRVEQTGAEDGHGGVVGAGDEGLVHVDLGAIVKK